MKYSRCVPIFFSFIFFAPLLCMEDGDAPRERQKLSCNVVSAAESGDLDYLKTLLADEVNPALVNVHCGEQGCTPLIMASQNGHYEIATFLLEKKADPNLSAYQGGTPVESACENGNLPIAQALLHANANPNQEDSHSLLVASQSGYDEIVTVLLKANADPERSDKKGLFPLRQACQDDHPKVIALLLDAKANPNKPDTMGETPIHIACEKGCHGNVSLLIEAQAYVNARGNYNYLSNKAAVGSNVTSLYLASQNGHVECMNILLTHGAACDINVVRLPDKTTPLMAAVSHNRYDAARVLLEHNADQTLQDFSQRRAMDFAKTPEMKTLLLSYAKSEEGKQDGVN